MANNEIKTNAEIYREQRKERLAKAAKKKKSGKGDKIIRAIVKTLCIILVAGIVIYGVGNVLTKVFCLPQKVLTAAKYDGDKINIAEYNYYYLSLYNQIVNTSQQYDSYYGTGYGAYLTGYDYTVDPAEQDYTFEDAPEGVETWADYFKVMASEKAFLNKVIYEEAISEDAKKAGFEITEEEQKEIDEEIKEVFDNLAENAQASDFSLNNYISKSCGEGLTEKTYRALIERDYMVEKYLTWYQENASEKTSADDIKSYYSEHKDEFDYASVRLFAISYAEASEDADSKDPVYTKKQAKERADEFLGKITTEASFVSLAKEYAVPSAKESFEEDSATNMSKVTKADTTQYSETLAKWMFDSARAVGDKAVIDDSANELYYVVYLTAAAAPDRETAGADVRHILVQAETTKEDSEGKEVDLSDKEIAANFAAAKTEAEKILKEWKDGEATEDSFAALAKEKTDDTGSAETGGLYEDITSTSSYVPEFLDWSLADHKVGDTGIIKTDYGYHIMYFVGADETEKWEEDVRSAIATEKYTDYTTELHEKVEAGIEKNDFIVDLFIKNLEKTISNYASQLASSAASSSLSY